MKPNISVLNAIMRITCGLTALAWATSRLARRPHRMSFLMVAMLGAMKVGEGIHRYCPVTDFMKQNAGKGEKEQRKSSSGHRSSEHGSSDHKSSDHESSDHESSDHKSSDHDDD